MNNRNGSDDTDTPPPPLPAPLSELTRNMHDIPIRDMTDVVNRPTSQRNQEAVRKGKVVRPMNAFILYRLAYTDRIKMWCRENNHQVVSRVSGQSWPMEPEEIREKYNAMAKTDRENHRTAHPDYKFEPARPQHGSGKNKISRNNAFPGSADDVHSSSLSSSSSFSSRPQQQSFAVGSGGGGVGGGFDVDNMSSTFGSRSTSPFGDIVSTSHGSPAAGGQLFPFEQSFAPPSPLSTSTPAGIFATPAEPAISNRFGLHSSPAAKRLLSAQDENDQLLIQNSGLPFASLSEVPSSALIGLPGGDHYDLLQPPTPPNGGQGQVDPRLLALPGSGNDFYLQFLPRPTSSNMNSNDNDNGANFFIPVALAPQSYQPLARESYMPEGDEQDGVVFLNHLLGD